MLDAADNLARLMQLLEAAGAAGEVFDVGSDEEISIQELAERVIRMAGSSSTIEHVDHERVYGSQFEDLPRRVPSLEKVRALVGLRRQFDLDQIIQTVIAEAAGAALAPQSPPKATA